MRRKNCLLDKDLHKEVRSWTLFQMTVKKTQKTNKKTTGSRFDNTSKNAEIWHFRSKS